MWTHVCEAWGHASTLGGRMPWHVPFSSKTVYRATPLCVERSQNTVLLASTQAVYKSPHSTV